ncbi:hypothetical protein CWE15_06135 [Aliidiomarina taiwanensis]|uniref:Ancillary SecYEG translocon subunit n=1 Tax=Aliidiomarina taiwanensis TaxID=946228 RepID=A0A432X7Z3_9GAMM|nr:tetratricopeptide repeat protein [Aliidiomarina taiwanensis]RUO42978.1 hypothetical protein CWE15_06135 [Aliidiomarina taiwanensis]
MANNDEQEVELVKNFIREYGPWIVAGLVIGLGSMFGWRSYQSAQQESAQAQTAAYEQALEQIQSPETAFSDELLNTLEGSSQAALTRLHLASAAVEEGDLEAAAEHLRKALAETSRAELQGVIGLRLARVELAREEFSAATSALALVTAPGYAALKAEVEGDIFVAQGQLTEAKAAYENAIALSQQGAHPFLQMKLDNLAAN